MGFPSEPLKKWCKNINYLIKVQLERLEGICECQLLLILEVPGLEVSQRKQLGSAFFWSVWIDQVMYYVLVDGGVPGIEKDESLYKEFRRLYPFPKLYSHPSSGFASPGSVLAFCEGKSCMPDRELLLEDKKEFWGEVAKWLDSIERSDVKEAAIKAFKEDIELRYFPPVVKSLWE